MSINQKNAATPALALVAGVLTATYINACTHRTALALGPDYTATDVASEMVSHLPIPGAMKSDVRLHLEKRKICERYFNTVSARNIDDGIKRVCRSLKNRNILTRSAHSIITHGG